MRPFTIYHTHLNLFASCTKKLVELVQQVVNPDVIYLLGATLNRVRTESIFNQSTPTGQFINNYYLLVLINEAQGRPLHEWQEMIEQKCAQFKETVVIVLTTKTFNEWLENGHRFARLVEQNAVKLLKADGVEISSIGSYDEESEAIEITRLLNRGKYMSEEFLAGAEIYIGRENYNLAGFMIHQALEQALSTLIIVRTGYEQKTHNIKRLLKYGALGHNKVKGLLDSFKIDIRNTAEIYYESRYSKMYIAQPNLLFALFLATKEVIYILNENKATKLL